MFLKIKNPSNLDEDSNYDSIKEAISTFLESDEYKEFIQKNDIEVKFEIAKQLPILKFKIVNNSFIISISKIFGKFMKKDELKDAIEEKIKEFNKSEAFKTLNEAFLELQETKYYNEVKEKNIDVYLFIEKIGPAFSFKCNLEKNFINIYANIEYKDLGHPTVLCKLTHEIIEISNLPINQFRSNYNIFIAQKINAVFQNSILFNENYTSKEAIEILKMEHKDHYILYRNMHAIFAALCDFINNKTSREIQIDLIDSNCILNNDKIIFIGINDLEEFKIIREELIDLIEINFDLKPKERTQNLSEYLKDKFGWKIAIKKEIKSLGDIKKEVFTFNIENNNKLPGFLIEDKIDEILNNLDKNREKNLLDLKKWFRMDPITVKNKIENVLENLEDLSKQIDSNEIHKMKPILEFLYEYNPILSQNEVYEDLKNKIDEYEHKVLETDLILDKIEDI